MNSPQIHRLTQVPSTLDLIHEYAARGAPHGTVVIANEQLEGRGTRGRAWHSPLGGLWYSILFRECQEPGVELLSLRIGLAVARAIESVVPGVRLGLKWPNDLMLTGKKLGGVLCEARWQGPALAWIAVGVGINVTNPVPAELQQTASSLESVAPGVTPDALIEPITRALRMMALDVNRLSSEELIELQGRDWLQGRELLEPVAGIARGVQSDGSLLVERPDGAMVTVRAGHLILG